MDVAEYWELDIASSKTSQVSASLQSIPDLAPLGDVVMSLDIWNLDRIKIEAFSPRVMLKAGWGLPAL